MDFKTLYIAWFTRLTNFAKMYVADEETAEDLVEDVFVRVYERWDSLPETIQIVSYLFTSVRHACQNHLRERMYLQPFKDANELELQIKSEALAALDADFSNEEELSGILQNAINKLPQRCREIFVMKKIEGKEQKEIATELGISENTVEAQMSIAYKKLRIELKHCKTLLWLWL